VRVDDYKQQVLAEKARCPVCQSPPGRQCTTYVRRGSEFHRDLPWDCVHTERVWFAAGWAAAMNQVKAATRGTPEYTS